MRSGPLLALCVTAVACSHLPLPAPSPTGWTTAVVPDTTCRSPIASASRAVRLRDELPRFEHPLDVLTGTFEITIVTTYPALLAADRTSSGTITFWSQDRIRRYHRVATVAGQLDAPMIDPGGGIRIGMPAEKDARPGESEAAPPNFLGLPVPDGSLRWTVGLGLDSGWFFGVYEGDGHRLVGRWSWLGATDDAVLAGYFCASR